MVNGRKGFNERTKHYDFFFFFSRLRNFLIKEKNRSRWWGIVLRFLLLVDLGLLEELDVLILDKFGDGAIDTFHDFLSVDGLDIAFGFVVRLGLGICVESGYG